MCACVGGGRGCANRATGHVNAPARKYCLCAHTVGRSGGFCLKQSGRWCRRGRVTTNRDTDCFPSVAVVRIRLNASLCANRNGSGINERIFQKHRTGRRASECGQGAQRARSREGASPPPFLDTVSILAGLKSRECLVSMSVSILCFKRRRSPAVMCCHAAPLVLKWETLTVFNSLCKLALARGG